MAAADLVNRCKFTPASTGTGDFVVSTAYTGFQTPASAGAVDGRTYHYYAESADLTQWEYGEGVYTVSSTTLARTTIKGSSTGSKVSFSTLPAVALDAFENDILSFVKSQSYSSGEQAQARANLNAAPLFASPGCGRLTKSGSNLLFSPYNGNRIVINSLEQTIPDAGVTLAAPATNGTSYFIYAYMNSGTMTLEASTTAHATQSGTGVEIKSGGATRTLVGQARTVSSAWVDSLTQRFVLSWLNRGMKAAFATGSGGSTTSTTATEINSSDRVEYLMWGDTHAWISAACTLSNNTATWFAEGYLNDNGTTVGGQYSMSINNGYAYAWAASAGVVGAEGYRYAGMKGSAQGGGTTASFTQVQISAMTFG